MAPELARYLNKIAQMPNLKNVSRERWLDFHELHKREGKNSGLNHVMKEMDKAGYPVTQDQALDILVHHGGSRSDEVEPVTSEATPERSSPALTETQESTDKLKGTLYKGDPASIESDHPEAHAALTDFVGAFKGRSGTRGILAQIKAGTASDGIIKQAAEKNPVLQGILDSEDGPAKIREILKHYGMSSSPATSPRRRNATSSPPPPPPPATSPRGGGGRGRRRRDEIPAKDEPPPITGADNEGSEYRGPEHLWETHPEIDSDLRQSTREVYDDARANGATPERIRSVQQAMTEPATYMDMAAKSPNYKLFMEDLRKKFEEKGTNISPEQIAEILAHYHEHHSGVEPKDHSENEPENELETARTHYAKLSDDAKEAIREIYDGFSNGKEWSDIRGNLSGGVRHEIEQFRNNNPAVFSNMTTHYNDLTKSLRRKNMLRKSKTPTYSTSILQSFRNDPPQRSTSDMQAEELARLMNRMYGYGVAQSLKKIETTFKRN